MLSGGGGSQPVCFSCILMVYLGGLLCFGYNIMHFELFLKNVSFP